MNGTFMNSETFMNEFNLLKHFKNYFGVINVRKQFMSLVFNLDEVVCTAPQN